MDKDYDGVRDSDDQGIAFVQVNAFDAGNKLVSSALSDLSGNYALSGLVDGQRYSIEIIKPEYYEHTLMGADQKGDVRFVAAPACGAHFGFFKPGDISLEPNPRIAVANFVGGADLSINASAQTIIGLEQNFNSQSPTSSLAKKHQTGAVYGLAYNRTYQKLYASSFVKYGAVLGPLGTGGIYILDRKTSTVSPFVNLNDFGINTGSTQGLTVSDCRYGDLVGKVGLGNMDISYDDKFLFVTNLFNKSVVILPTQNPSSSNVMEIKIPNPGCKGGDYAVSAVKYHDGQLYIGVTCTAGTSLNPADCAFHIYELNLTTRVFNLILSSDFMRAYWPATQGNFKGVSQWLTDLDFNRFGEMILGISDRKGHAHCFGLENLTNQKGDILVAFKSASGWVLENGGFVNGRAGSGLNHLEGPGRGEFFGHDYWVIGPSLHPEISTGTLAAAMSRDEVINVVFDPIYESFTGGLQRYNTLNGKKVGAIQLYGPTSSDFGKASGLGDVEVLNQSTPVEIGNLLWLDKDSNGVQEADEKGIAGVRISIYDSKCRKVGSQLTGLDGSYLFDWTNVDTDGDGQTDGLQFGETYFVVIDDPRYIKFSNSIIIGEDTLTLTYQDKLTGGLLDARDSDASLGTGDLCDLMEGLPVAKVVVGHNGHNVFNVDIGLMPSSDTFTTPVDDFFDLALIKKVKSLGQLRKGDPVDFEIEVHNQGSLIVSEYSVIDYIPSGLQFDPAENPGWALVNGNAELVVKNNFIPGAVDRHLIRLRLTGEGSLGEIVNTAEIFRMKDALGELAPDHDSTPDKIAENDKGGQPNTATDNSLSNPDDEDDHDREAIYVNDLALVKRLKSGATAARGDLVQFEIEVRNQGNTMIPAFQVTDYIPSGFEFIALDNPGWSSVGDLAVFNYNAGIPAGASRLINISLRIRPDASTESLLNVAEISGMYDAAGQSIMDRDSKADQNPANDAGGQVGSAFDDYFDGDGLNDEDDHDAAVPLIADLALVKQSEVLHPVRRNDIVVFRLNVMNQGAMTVGNYSVVDYIPSGLEFVSGLNPGWVFSNGQARFTDPISLAPGARREIKIRLKVVSQDPAGLINEAEIFGMKDVAGRELTDWDSHPDLIQGNDPFVALSVDQKSQFEEVDGDEDDSDSEELLVADLALIVTTTKQTPVKKNEDVIFQIRICNQGNLPVSEVEFANYTPQGLSLSPLDNHGWMFRNGLLVNSINQVIAPGECATREILLRVGENAHSDNVLNRAEILAMKDLAGNPLGAYDFDSTPDANPSNDNGGLAGTATDNYLGGDGTDDEDDADPEQLRIMDVSLTKVNTSAGSLIYKGQVQFQITVTNNSNIAVRNIRVTDYLPAGFTVNQASLSQGWSLIGDNVRYTFNQTIAPGQSAGVSILLNDLGTAIFDQIVNTAEVSFIESAEGTDYSAFDFDSETDEDPTNDLPGEDDIDSAPIEVFDLALSKVLTDKGLIYKSGDPVNFKVTVHNQGNLEATSIKIVDYLDTNFVFDAAINPGWNLDANGVLYFNLSGTIIPGGSKSADLILKIKPNRDGLIIPNFAEISSARTVEGRNLQDYDSQPDQNSANDKYVEGSDLQDHGELDEDDHDGTNTNPNNFDLALRKTINQRVVQRGQNVDWTITITNEGTAIASEIVVVDYIPDGTTLVSTADWLTHATHPEPGKYYYTFSVKNGRLPQDGLKPGESVQAVIRLKINEDRSSGQLINRAEIYSAVNPYSIVDEDSTPDDDFANDGLEDYMAFMDKGSATDPETGEVIVTEDDADLSGVYLLEIKHSDCVCLNNASTPYDGQFRTRLTLESRTGEIWFIREVNGLYRVLPSSPPPAPPMPFTTGLGGFTLQEISINGPVTVFGMNGIHIDGIGFDIILENQFGDKVSLGNVRCNYDEPVLREAQTNVCATSTVRYSVDYRAGSTYVWTLSSGGVINSGTNSHAVSVAWTGAPNSTHKLAVKEYNPGMCLKPLELAVTLGATPGPVSCIGDLQVSLGANCEAKVTPQMLLVGGPYDYNSYSVMLMNKDGSLVPNNIVTYEHVGKKLTAKLINACNGNTCWTTITVEDKTRPVIVCLNDTIDCTRMKSHLGPLVYDACDLNPVKTLLDEKIENTPCNPLYSKIVTRYYVAKDASGNVSLPCTAQYFLKRIDFDSIVFPDSLMVSTRNPLLCGKFAADSTGRPLPSATGIPKYHGSPIWPNQDTKYCDFSASYEDFEVPTGKNCTRKFLRTWKFIIWYCTSFDQIVYNQLVEIVDDEAPQMDCPYDIDAIIGGYTCEANVWIPMPKVTDNCSQDIRLDLVYPGGFIKDYTARYVTLPEGDHTLEFRAYDNCLNVQTCQFHVLVRDQAAPVVQCDRETVVTLDRFGRATIPAEVFDDGSYDNCGLHSFKVMRMDGGAPCAQQISVPSDSVDFCCQDLNNLVTVLFMATDHSGNTNTCMVQVEVQDKTIPFIYCPHDVTIDCHEHIDRNDLSRFGTATASDNCDVTVTEIDSFHIDQCREGRIERIFVAGNAFGQTSCVQTIYIVNHAPFDSSDITWPQDFDTISCASDILDPANLPAEYGYPIVNEDVCDLVGISYEDHTFRIVSGSDACYKVLRKWQVINWCRFRDAYGNPIVYNYDQTIKVYNTVAPSITSDCKDYIFETKDTSCFSGNATLISTAQDDCTADDLLRNEYHIDLYSNGTFDINAIGSGNLINASGEYPLGKHRIRFVFEDLCGNKSVCESNFEIVNKKAPVAYCLKGLSAGLVPWDINGDGKIDGEFVEIWARDFDRGSYHPCGYDLTYSIGRDTSVKSIRYDCDSIGIRIVEFCVTASNGEQSCCETFIEIQDNNKVDFCNCLEKPRDITVSDCEQKTSPIDLNSFPKLGNCNCTDVDITHSDRIISGPRNTCFVIERTWDAKFNCVDNDFDFTFIQKITVTTDLKLSDITWPKDSVVVDNCLGSTDTTLIGETPRVCSYQGQVMVMYADRTLSQNGNERVVERIWTVFSKCVTDGSQTFTFRQILRVINSTGVRYMVPDDITVTDCKASLLPPDLNGYPKVNCPCPNVTHRYTDSIATGGTQACYTIFRRWTSTYNCPPDVMGTYRGTQRIIVSIDLRLQDIMWGADSIRQEDCSGKIDTGRIGGVPKLLKDFCGYVSISYVDTVKIDNDTCRIVQRTWTVNNLCRSGAQAQVFRRNQIIKVLFPNGPRLVIPADITVNNCALPLLPDSLNGYPTIECGCDSLEISYVNDTVRNNPEVCFTINRTWTVRVRCRPIVDTVLTGLQRITLDVNLDPNDINWPQDSFTSYTCVPTLDPNIIGRPTLNKDYCGLVKFSFVDTIRSGNPCRFVERTWRATNDCSPTQVFTFKQYIITKNQTPPSITCPPDVTVNADSTSCGAVVNLPDPTLNDDCNGGVTYSDNAPPIFPVGKTNVTFTATDSCSNTSTCITMVTVVEIIPPTIDCPDDMTVGCDVDTEDLDQFGQPNASDNCPGVTVRDSVIRNQNLCGIGTITRIFIATDASGNTKSCTQVVTVENADPISNTTIQWPPSPITVDECGSIDTSMTGYPKVPDTLVTCFKLRITYSDSNLCKVRSGCEIERYWEVFDSCTNQTFNFTQLIIRDDQNAPVINVPFMDTTLYALPDDCNNFVNLVATIGGCDSALVVVTNNSPYGGNGMEDASGFYPVGTTIVTFTAEDPCCNVSTKEVRINVVDTIAPEVTCKKVIRPIVDSNLCATFNSQDFIALLGDNCTDSALIMTSFDINNFNDTLFLICCDSIGQDREYTTSKTIYFKDEAGNIDSCVTLLQAIDFDSLCPLTLRDATVQGIISSRKDKKLEGIEILLNDGSAGRQYTGGAGFYAFRHMPLGGRYVTRPHYDQEHNAGVSTYDLVLIQRHILGIKSFDNPYQWIAADVNKSSTVTASDISELRKLILGITDKFSRNTSWRFVHSDYQWDEPDFPLFEKFAESVEIPALLKSHTLNFTGIKVGDVDDSNPAGRIQGEVAARTQGAVLMHANDKKLSKGEEYEVEINLMDWSNLEGLQGALRFHTDHVSLISIDNDQTDVLNQEHYSLLDPKDGLVRISWTRDEEIKGDWKLRIRIRSEREQYLSDILEMDQSVLNAEAYAEDGSLKQLRLEFFNGQKTNSAAGVRLYQNIPNPFNQSTIVPFELDEAASVTLNVMDINGRVLHQRTLSLQKGYHEIELSKRLFGAPGVYYYQIQTGTEKYMRRMVLID